MYRAGKARTELVLYPAAQSAAEAAPQEERQESVAR